MIFFNNITTQIFSNSTNLALAVLLLPFLSFVVLFFFAHHLPRKGDTIAAAFSGLTFILSIVLFFRIWGKEVASLEQFWFAIPGHDFTVSIKINDNTVIMLLLVSFISFLVHIYSIEYMKGKKNYVRYFPYLGIFTFSMIGIVISDNLLITFMFWELVGFSSYLLIGFWYDKEAAVKAAKKAFLFNRIGDTGFIIAILALYSIYGSLDLSYIQSKGIMDSEWIFWIGLGIFLGCVGKSAQFPLQAWLPDAMEGPTPVSALIHAATMVAAGVYLLIKVNFLLMPEVLTIIAFTGALTAIMGALPALFQYDIKKVLAYSTISQLGYMMMAVGVGSFDASFFHLITHGFFKACLFLSAGAVIHFMHEMKHEILIKGKFRYFDSQDMRLMGAIRKRMPLTFVCYILSAFALIGLPLFSGFLSKDAILEGAIHWAASGNRLFYLVPILAYSTVFITAVYMIRQMTMVFFGEFRLGEKYPIAKEVFNHLKDPSLLMTIPLIILSVFCIWVFFSPNPLTAEHGWLFKMAPMHFMTEFISVSLSTAGILMGYWVFRKKQIVIPGENEQEKESISFNIFRNNWYLDRAYYYLLVVPGFKTAYLSSIIDTKIIDRCIHLFAMLNVTLAHVLAWVDRVLVDGGIRLLAWVASESGAIARSFQSGRIQGYFVFALLGTIILLVWIIIL